MGRSETTEAECVWEYNADRVAGYEHELYLKYYAVLPPAFQPRSAITLYALTIIITSRAYHRNPGNVWPAGPKPPSAWLDGARTISS